MSNTLKIKFIGNGNIVQAFFFNTDLNEILDKSKGKRLSKYLKNKAEFSTYFANGFSRNIDLRTIITIGKDKFYEGEIYVNDTWTNDTDDLIKIRKAFRDMHGHEFEHVLTFNDNDRRSPDEKKPDFSKFKFCIIQNVNLDGYNAKCTIELDVDKNFKLSDMPILISDFDACIGQSRCNENLISKIYRFTEVEEEVIGLVYKGKNYLLSDGKYESDLIIDPYTFIDTTEYSAYLNKNEEWDYLDFYEKFLELNEEEKDYY